MPSDTTDSKPALPAESNRDVCTAEQRRRLVRLAYRFVWNLHDAEDAVQDALIAAQQNVGKLREQRSWWSWVVRVVVQRCHLHGREKRRKELALRRVESRAGFEAGPAVHDALSPYAEKLRQALADLPDRQREVLVLRHLEDLTYERIGEVLGISPSTARVHAHAGRESLRNRMANQDERNVPYQRDS